MPKLEWKGCPRSNKIEDIEVLLIGDSMIKSINCEQFRNTTWLYAYPGITAEQLRFHLQNEVGLPPPSKIGVVYIHVGTNNVSTLREQKAGPAIIHEQKGVISIVQQIYKSAVVLCGAILPRYDQENPRAIEVNKAIEKYCLDAKNPQLQYVDLWDRFYNQSDLYRYAQTMNRRNLDPDPVHLSDKGVQYLQQEIRKDIEKAVKLKLTLKTNVGEVMTTEEWRRFRTMTCNDRMTPRFKVTNYREGANTKDQVVPYRGPQLSYSTPIAAVNPLPAVQEPKTTDAQSPSADVDYRKLSTKILPEKPKQSSPNLSAPVAKTSPIAPRAKQSVNNNYRQQHIEKRRRSSKSPTRRKRLGSPDPSPEKRKRRRSTSRSRRSRSRSSKRRQKDTPPRRSRRSLEVRKTRRRKRSSSSSDRSPERRSSSSKPSRKRRSNELSRKSRSRSPIARRSSNSRRRSSSRQRRKPRSPSPKVPTDSSNVESSSSSESEQSEQEKTAILFTQALLKERLKRKRAVQKKTPPRQKSKPVLDSSCDSDEEVYLTPTKKQVQRKGVTKASLEERLREKKVHRTVKITMKAVSLAAHASDDDEILTDTEFD